jgi:amidohydrolase
MDAKQAVADAVTEFGPDLLELSHRIHAHPELGFEEELAAVWCGEVITDAGLDVEAGIGDLPTAFRATAGSGPLHLSFCVEYDALPGIGHACGHNMIAAMSIGAGLAAARVADHVGLTVTILGTPAEEVGDAGGKILLLERGAFEGHHASMMLHPGPVDAGDVPWNAASMFECHYEGRASHAAAAPELGVNAADAVTVAQTAIGLLRQHLDPDALVHGIVIDGGDAPNIVPGHAGVRYIVRAPDLDRLEVSKQRVLKCFEAGALATGATLEIRGGTKAYAEVRNDRRLMAAYTANAEALGRELVPKQAFAGRGAASTDMGNVSLAVPSIHPLIGIDSLPAVPHQPEFARHAITEVADKAIIDGATALAQTAVDAAVDDDLRAHLLGTGG